MSIASEITRLQGCKTDMQDALVNKGISSASSHDMADFAVDISNISLLGATITVTYSSDYYGKVMTCSNGTTTYTKTTTSSGSIEFDVSEGGIWTITCDDVSKTVTVKLSYAVQIRPNGKYVTPVNDVQIWLQCCGILDKSYTTISEVLADSTTLLGLISDRNSVNYMVRSTSWASTVCANATAMTDIGANNYCADTLLADTTWRTAICNSAYFESVLNVKVPTMTSNTTPSGIASASSVGASYSSYKAFDGDASTQWICAQGETRSWIAYDFNISKKIKIYKVYLKCMQNGTFYPKTDATFDGYDETTQTWDVINNNIVPTVVISGGEHTTIILPSKAYKKFRVSCSYGSAYGKATGFVTVQFYGRYES